MNVKWPVIVLSLLVFSSCGNQQKEKKPFYTFSIGETNIYNISANLNASADMGFFKYSGKMGITGELTLRADRTNSNGIRIIADIRNPKITGGDSRLNPSIYMSLNSIRGLFANFTMTPEGRKTQVMDRSPDAYSLAILDTLFPDFTDWPSYLRGRETRTNIAVSMQGIAMVIVYNQSCTVTSINDRTLTMEQVLDIPLYEPIELEKSVDPRPQGRITIKMTDQYDLLRGMLISRSGTMEMTASISVKQGFLSYTFNMQADGTLDMKYVPRDPA